MPEELSLLVGELRDCGERLVAIAEILKAWIDEENAKAKKKSAKKSVAKAPEQPIPAPQPEERQPTLEEVRAVCADKSRQGYTENVKALITKYGASRLSDVKPENYKALMADVEVLGNA